MHLPAELRNTIYELVLVKEKSIEISHSPLDIAPHEPVFLSTTLAIRKEAAPVYYGANTFDVCDIGRAGYWLGMLSKRARSLVRSIRLTSFTSHPFKNRYPELYEKDRGALWHCHAQGMLKRMQKHYPHFELNETVVKMPLLVHGESGFTWVSLADFAQYEVEYINPSRNRHETRVVRKESIVAQESRASSS